MEVGLDAYKQKDELELAILKSINAIPVYRNTGIDGFLKEMNDEKPIPIKIQKASETLDEAKRKLISAAKVKLSNFVVLLTNQNCDNQEVSLTEEFGIKLLLIPKYECHIKDALNGKILSQDINKLLHAYI